MYTQVWLLIFLASLFGPMLPILFMYCFSGLLINDIVSRLRIAYTVKSFPKYEGIGNSYNLLGIALCIFVYACSAAVVYSDKQIFWNEVIPNESASVFFA